jgi:hypothetical protein
MQRITTVATSNFSQWKKEEIEIWSLYKIVKEDPLLIHPIFDHFYGFLFLNSVAQFYNPLLFANEIRSLFDKIATSPPSNDMKMLAWAIQEKFSEMLTEDQKFRMISVLDDQIEIKLTVEKAIPNAADLQILKEKTSNAFAKYKSFSESQQSGLFSRWNPTPSHGQDGINKAQKFFYSILACDDIENVNDKVKEFFNSSTGCRSHSFVSYFLDSIASDQEFLQKTTVHEIYLQRATAVDILNRRGLFILG